VEAFDVAVVGAGPAGSVCAAQCASAGLRTLLLERTRFPREKVCGDCLNPGCWPVFERLGIADRVRELVHAPLGEVAFMDANDRMIFCPLPRSECGEIAVKRSLLDALLLARASECGTAVHEGATVTGVSHAGQAWRLATTGGDRSARFLVAADGRNSTVARLLNLLPASRKDRVGVQAHIPLPRGEDGRVTMRFLREGYCGLADVGGDEANLCLVSRPPDLPAIQAWASRRFDLPADQVWRSITPLRRSPAPAARDGLLLAGDAARVVEPFTGEGIFYALASGELAAKHLIAGNLESYASAHAALYRGRLWVNELARIACLSPRFASALLSVARWQPRLLGLLTRKVVSAA
jgi:menaquinone-9 beta-reductase